MFNHTLSKSLYLLLERNAANVDDIEHLITAGADVNYICPIESYSCLSRACYPSNFKLDVIETLLKHGAKDDNGTSLSISMSKDSLSMFKLLIKYGSDPTMVINFKRLLRDDIFNYFKNYTIQKRFLDRYPLLYKQLNHPYYETGDGLWFNNFPESTEIQKRCFLHPKILKEFAHLENADNLGLL